MGEIKSYPCEMCDGHDAVRREDNLYVCEKCEKKFPISKEKKGERVKKELVKKLKERAEDIARMFSHKDRQFNFNSEMFEVVTIKPLSESTAVVWFKKEPTKKTGLAFLYWINGSGGRWQYFFPTYDHCIGMERVKEELFVVEESNFDKN